MWQQVTSALSQAALLRALPCPANCPSLWHTWLVQGIYSNSILQSPPCASCFSSTSALSQQANSTSVTEPIFTCHLPNCHSAWFFFFLPSLRFVHLIAKYLGLCKELRPSVACCAQWIHPNYPNNPDFPTGFGTQQSFISFSLTSNYQLNWQHRCNVSTCNSTC